MTPKIWMNRKLVPESEAKVSIWDRGFLYGDGAYETVRVYEGKIFRAEAHWKRLDNSLKGLALRIPWSHADLNRACMATIRANGLKESLVRVTITRGVGELGYDPRSCKHPTLVVLAVPVRHDLASLWRNGVKISVVGVRRNSLKSLSPALKHINCLNGILAKMESLKRGAFEAVFLNLDGEVAEGTISNIFLIKNGVLKTPMLESGLLRGVTRAAVLETARKLRIPVRETRIKPAEIDQADEIFLTSTTMEAMPVVRVDQRKVGGGVPGPLTGRIHRQLRQTIQKELQLSPTFLSGN